MLFRKSYSYRENQTANDCTLLKIYTDNLSPFLLTIKTDSLF